MKSQKKKSLKEYEPEQILTELHTRQCNTPDISQQNNGLSEASIEALCKQLNRDQKLVYGVDDRLDIYEISDPTILALAESIVSLVDISVILDQGDGNSEISTTPFAIAQSLCSTERFGNQPTAAFCSGFLVAPDIIATAGHCIDNNNLARTRFVFGFRMLNADEAQVKIPNDDIFQGIGIIDRKLDRSSGSDYALVRLDRPVINRPILDIRRTGIIDDSTDVFVMGHPSGLPLKFADGAQVRVGRNSNPAFFTANLDTYGGNSGSPVFSESEKIVEGILVRGDTDFVRVGNCFISNVCPTTGCQGEDITRTTEFASNVPVKDVDGDDSAESGFDERLSRLEQVVDGIAKDVREIRDRTN